RGCAVGLVIVSDDAAGPLDAGDGPRLGMGPVDPPDEPRGDGQDQGSAPAASCENHDVGAPAWWRRPRAWASGSVPATDVRAAGLRTNLWRPGDLVKDRHAAIRW